MIINDTGVPVCLDFTVGGDEGGVNQVQWRRSCCHRWEEVRNVRLSTTPRLLQSSQHDQLYQLAPASSDGNISLIWKLKTICNIPEKQFFLSGKYLCFTVHPSSVDRPYRAQYIKPPGLPNTLIKTIVFENNKNQTAKTLSNLTNYKLATSSSRRQVSII